MKTFDYTVRDTGVTLHLKKVSPFLLNEIRKQNPPPAPPLSVANYGTAEEPDFREEPNPNDPRYQKELIAYQERMQMLAQEAILTMGVEITLTQEQIDELNSLRAKMKTLGIELSPNDKIAYILYIALGTPDDVGELTQAITARSMPQPEAVEAYKVSFQSNLPR